VTLRRSLVLVLAGLSAAALLIVSGTGAIALRAYLLDRVDDQLAGAAELARSRAPLLAVDPSERNAAVRQVVSVTEYVIEIRGADSGTVRVLAGAPLPARPLMERARLDDTRPQTVAGYRAVVVRDDDLTVLVALSLQPLHDTVRQAVLVAAGTSIGVLIALVCGARLLVGRRLRPIDALAAAATEMADGRLDHRVPQPRDAGRTEVGRLTAAINAMFARVQASVAAQARSEQRMRTFVADASHELRTPLTSIRGYLQLVRTGVVDLRDRPDVLRRMEQEASRMGSMVASLLYLARMDAEPPSRRAPVDLVPLIRDAVADAAAVEPDRPLGIEAPDQCRVPGDADALRQVMANLLANVRAHTPPGTAARVRLLPGAESVRVEVSDDGPGLDPAAAEHAFKRFWRADSARSASGGAGLGLAIVADVVHAHGGEAGFDGATVWFTLPRDS
jgi:two-component system OmpR family sensor kinase